MIADSFSCIVTSEGESEEEKFRTDRIGNQKEKIDLRDNSSREEA